jgi:hypothetical protein
MYILGIHACSNPSPCHEKVLLNVDKHLTILTQIYNILICNCSLSVASDGKHSSLNLLYSSIQWYTFISVIYDLLYKQYRAKCFEILFLSYNKNYSEIYSFVIAFNTHVRYNFEQYTCSNIKLVKSMLYRFVPCLYYFK